MKDDFEKSFFNVSTKVRKIYGDMAETIKPKIPADLVQVWWKMEAHIQVESTRLVVSAGDLLLHHFPDVENLFGKNLALFSIRVTKALDVESNSGKGLFVGAKRSKRPGKVSGLKSATKPDEGPSSRNVNINVDSVQAKVL